MIFRPGFASLAEAGNSICMFQISDLTQSVKRLVILASYLYFGSLQINKQEPPFWVKIGSRTVTVPRSGLEENCDLPGSTYVQGQIKAYIFEAKWRLLCLLSFNYF